MRHLKTITASLPPTLTVIVAMLVMACGTKTPEPATSDKVKKVWTAQTVKENNTLVYTKGAMGNIRNYVPFRLDLNNSPTATLTDWDGVICTGQYDILNDTRLVLKNLNPQPSNTNGTLEFTINSIGDSQLDLTRVTTNSKTGGTTNQYLLTNL